jgi:hypothetical protein
MAHYVAGLIKAAKLAPAAKRNEAERTAADAILELWRHHNVMPSGRRPFEELEPVVELLRHLSQDNAYYYRHDALGGIKFDDQGEKVKEWLRLMEGLDYSARLLMEYALKNAVTLAGKRARGWNRVVKEHPAFQTPTTDIVMILYDQLEGREWFDDQHRKDLELRISRLDGLLKFAGVMRQQLSTELKDLPKPVRKKGPPAAKSGKRPARRNPA